MYDTMKNKLLTNIRYTKYSVDLTNQYKLLHVRQRNGFVRYYLVIGVLIKSSPTRAKNFTNYVFCHPQFSGDIQNFENRCAILTPLPMSIIIKITNFIE